MEGIVWVCLEEYTIITNILMFCMKRTKYGKIYWYRCVFSVNIYIFCMAKDVYFCHLKYIYVFKCMNKFT